MFFYEFVDGNHACHTASNMSFHPHPFVVTPPTTNKENTSNNQQQYHCRRFKRMIQNEHNNQPFRVFFCFCLSCLISPFSLCLKFFFFPFTGSWRQYQRQSNINNAKLPWPYQEFHPCCRLSKCGHQLCQN